jgi:hypothetical protein
MGLQSQRLDTLDHVLYLGAGGALFHHYNHGRNPWVAIKKAPKTTLGFGAWLIVG